MTSFSYRPDVPFSSALSVLMQAPATDLLKVGVLIPHAAFGDEDELKAHALARALTQDWPTRTRFSGESSWRLVYLAGQLQRLKLQFARHRNIDWVEREIFHQFMMFMNDELVEGHLVFTARSMSPSTPPSQRIQQIFDAMDAALVIRTTGSPRPRRTMEFVPVGRANARFVHDGQAAVVVRANPNAVGFVPIAITVLESARAEARQLATIQGFHWVPDPRQGSDPTKGAGAWGLSFQHDALWGEVGPGVLSVMPEPQQLTGYLNEMARAVYIDHITTAKEVAGRRLGLRLVRALIQECAGHDALVAAFVDPVTASGAVSPELYDKLKAYAAPLGFVHFREGIYLQHAEATHDILLADRELQSLE
jgi:hypothetical protein